MQIESLYVYPLKSGVGQDASFVDLDAWGVSGDRRWMWVDEQGSFLTQRMYPVLGQISARWLGGMECLELQRVGAPETRLQVMLPVDLGTFPESALRSVRVWQDRPLAWDAGDQARRWLRDVCGLEGALVYMPSGVVRSVDGATQARVGFADAYPLLVLGTASLKALNARLERPVTMASFRPNIVVKTSVPFVEDRWLRIRVGGVELRVVKACSRCVMVNVVPKTTTRRADVLRTLAHFRRGQGQVWFGQNAVCTQGFGRVACGDLVDVLEEGISPNVTIDTIY